MNWKHVVDNLYETYDFVQGNKNDYKKSITNYGEILLNEDKFTKYSKKIFDLQKNHYGPRSFGSQALALIEGTTQEEFYASYKRVSDDFKRIKEYEDLNILFNHYKTVVDEVFFQVYDKQSTSMEINTFFSTRVKYLIESKSIKNENSLNVSYFTMRCGDNNKYYNDFVNNKFIAITWNGIDNVSNYDYNQLKEYSNVKYPDSRSYTQFNTFINAMSIGDIVCIMKKGTKKVDLVIITSDVIYDETLIPEYSNYRTVEILKEKVELDFTYNIQSAIEQIRNDARLRTVKEKIDSDINERYSKIMDNIGITRNFKFEYQGKDTIIEEDNAEFIKDYKQLIIDGAPGTSKSYSLNKEITDNSIRHERVTFYQDYEYHNLVGSILPVVNDGSVSYEFVKGPFTKLLNDAFANPESKHYLVIEELTRGNAPAIFGDIFQLLDRDSDGWSRYPISNDSIFTSLDAEVQVFLNSNINFKGKVVLPPNFSIICTINSSDQNVYPLDTAFKRRFNYEIKSTEASNDFNNFDIYFGNEEDKLSIDWIKFQSKLNDYILNNLKLNEDKQVGPYFIKESDTSASIQTKLAMYMWNDLQKVHTMNGNKIFNDKVKTLYKVDELFRTGSKEEIRAILTEEFIDKIGLK